MKTVTGALTVTLCDITLMARVMMGWEEPLSRSPKIHAITSDNF